MNNEGTDMFGYSRRVHAPGEVLSSEYATLAMEGGDNLTLLQSCQAGYTQQVQPVFEAGSSDLFWVAGQASGTCTIGRAVGKEGFLTKFGTGNCAELRSLDVALDGRGGCAAVTTGSGVSMSGCMPRALGFTFGAGQLQMQETVEMLVASMRKA